MCEEETAAGKGRITVRQVLASFGSSGAAGAAKASPGVAVGVGAVELFSTDLQTWITIGTFVYILMMLIYSAPKVVEAVRYFIRLWKNRSRQVGIYFSEARDHDITDKLQELRIKELEAEVADLRRRLSDGA